MPHHHDGEVVDLYLRKSTKDEGRSVERQLGELTEASTVEGLTVGRVFVDPDFSASRFAKRARPDYAALLQHIRSGDCRVLGLFEGSRGSRTLTEWSSLLDECRARQIRIWIQADERVYRPWKTNDWDALARMGVQSATESNVISDRVLSGKRKAAREGKPPGRLQYGFTRVYDATGKFVEQKAHPVEGPIVAEMVRRVAEGDTLATIAGDLNSRGFAMPGGQPWHGRFVRQMILRPSYAGRRVHQGQDVGPAAWEPIVDVPEWRKAVTILTRPERRSTTRGTALTHWLTGAVTCGACQAHKLRAINGGTARARKIQYMCEGCLKVFISAHSLEAFVERMLLARLSQADALPIFENRTDGAAVKAAEDAVATLEERLEEHYREAARGLLSSRGISAIEGELLPEIEKAKKAKEDLRRLTVATDQDDLDMADVPARWGGFSPAMKRRYVRALIELVVMPAIRRGSVFDQQRLRQSRWRGHARTWGDAWADTVR